MWRECYAVLHRHFTGKSEAANDTVDPDKADKTLSFPERIRAVTEARQSFDTIAAREMWFKMGLPIVPSMLRPQPYQGVLFSYEAIRHPDREAEDKAA